MAKSPIELFGFNDTEKQIAIAWTQAHFTQFLASNPNAPLNERIKEFSNILEGSLYVVDELRNGRYRQ